MAPVGINRNLIVNRDVPPFDNPDLRQAMALSLDRQAFIDILTEGQGDIGGVMQPPPAGLWGMPPDMLQTLPGYGPDIQKNRADARQIMQKLGYGPDNRLKIKVSVRDLPYLRDPAVILIDQLKEVYIDGELETIDTTNWFPKVMRKDYIVGLTGPGSGPDPDQNLDLIYGCGAELNYNGYCNPEVDKLIDQQSIEADQEKRKQLVWEIERKLAEDGARPIIFYDRRATCWQPACEGADADGQQPLQRLAHGRRLARSSEYSRRQTAMKRDRRRLSAAAWLLAAMAAAAPAVAQKPGGILHAGHFDSPASMSMLEESTLAVNRPSDGRLQQSGDVRPAGGAEQPAIDRPGSGDRVELE